MNYSNDIPIQRAITIHNLSNTNFFDSMTQLFQVLGEEKKHQSKSIHSSINTLDEESFTSEASVDSHSKHQLYSTLHRRVFSLATVLTALLFSSIILLFLSSESMTTAAATTTKNNDSIQLNSETMRNVISTVTSVIFIFIVLCPWHWFEHNLRFLFLRFVVTLECKVLTSTSNMRHILTMARREGDALVAFTDVLIADVFTSFAKPFAELMIGALCCFYRLVSSLPSTSTPFTTTKSPPSRAIQLELPCKWNLLMCFLLL